MSAPDNRGSLSASRDLVNPFDAPENPASDSRYVTGATAPEERRSVERYRIFRLCECAKCEGTGKAVKAYRVTPVPRCPECRGEGRVRQEIATCPSPESVGVALVTLGREGEFEDCPVGCLDTMGEPGQRWIFKPWGPSPRNISDAARTLAKAKR